MIKKVLLFGVIALAFACGKYEEGPKFSLESKKSRLVGEWKVTSITKNGVDQSLPGTTVEYRLKTTEPM